MIRILQLKSFIYLLIAGIVVVQSGCSVDQNNAGSEAEVAFNDFKEYVTSTEITPHNQAPTTPAEWDKNAAEAQATYNEKVARLDQHEAEYHEGRQEEIADLKNRFNLYWQQRETEYQAQAKVFSSDSVANSTVAADFQINDVAATSPANIRLAFENLVNRIQAQKESYSKNDWKLINDYYLSLDKRLEAVQTELSDKDKLAIAEAKAKYVALRTAARFDPDVSETAAAVKSSAVSTGQKVGDKAEKAGSEIKRTAKSGAEKVENAAQKAGSEVKSITKKVAKEIDSKINNDPTRD